MGYMLRLAALVLLDSFLICLALFLSLWFRFEGNIAPQYVNAFRYLAPLGAGIGAVSLYGFRLYHRLWQYASIGELEAIVKANTAATIAFVALIYVGHLPTLPRSVYIASWLLMNVFIGGSRLGWRILRQYLASAPAQDSKKTLIVGAGDAGALVARELLNNKELRLSPAGFVDDDRNKQKLSLMGVPVLGTRDSIPDIVRNHAIEEVIVAMPSVDGKTMREIMEICRHTGAQVRIFAGAEDFLNGDKKKIRAVKVEDLLRREPVRVDLEEIAGYITNRTVLITGAGGSIGSELCRQVGRFSPQRLVMLDCCENNLFEIETEFMHIHPETTIQAELVDVRDRDRLEAAFRKYKPNVVFHAAAFKHVPMMERYPEEAFENNVVGTRNVAEAAHNSGTEIFVLISTDKAVNPTSVMGATKRLAEMVIQDLNRTSPTKFAAVRFGNVLGSRGSVVPTFNKQIAKGGPVTVTHPDMVRYFMTIPEAVQLIIQAGAIAKGGEIFVLDMGEPVKIVDLARDLIKLSGLEPDRDIEIVFTGIRPGEKMYEELLTSEEGTTATKHKKIFIAKAGGTDPYLNETVLKRLSETSEKGANLRKDEVLFMIKRLIPEFRADGKGLAKTFNLKSGMGALLVK
jgi:FlaA1/EpsC-like NDP-sugar epimerase